MVSKNIRRAKQFKDFSKEERSLIITSCFQGLNRRIQNKEQADKLFADLNDVLTIDYSNIKILAQKGLQYIEDNDRVKKY